MECINIIKTRGGVACKMGNTLYVPTTFELTFYCNSGAYQNCPFLKAVINPVSFRYIPSNSGSVQEGRFDNEDRYGERGCSEGI